MPRKELLGSCWRCWFWPAPFPLFTPSSTSKVQATTPCANSAVMPMTVKPISSSSRASNNLMSGGSSGAFPSAPAEWLPAPGREPTLVIPGFGRLFREVEVGAFSHRHFLIERLRGFHKSEAPVLGIEFLAFFAAEKDSCLLPSKAMGQLLTRNSGDWL